MTQERILITSALPYANGPLHFGHIIGAYLPADCYRRFEKLQKNDVIYICGSDEYGVAITLSAEMAKRTPKEHVDIYHEINQKLFAKLNIVFDYYSRTTSNIHKETTQQFFLDLYEGGYIEERETNQFFSEKENRFLADRYIIGICPKCGFDKARGDECTKCGASYESCDLKNPRSKISNDTLMLKKTKHWYLLFDKFKEPLKKWLSKKDWKQNVLNFAMEYVDNLKPRSITRDLPWGIPVPLKEAEGKVFYVWFDAPIGYVSATKEWAKTIKKPEAWENYWLDPSTKLVQFIGKDNIPFHAVFFPAMLMGQKLKYKLPDEIPANEFFLLEGRQFSKSDNWYIDLDEFFKKYSVDQARYFLASNAPEMADAEFSFKEFQLRCNSELVGKLGNFIHRVMTFTMSHNDGLIPKMHDLLQEDKHVVKEASLLVDEAYVAYKHFHLRKASQLVMQLAQLGNVYFDQKKPWVLCKDLARKGEMDNCLAVCFDLIKKLALIAYPIMPKSCDKIMAMLGYEDGIERVGWSDIKNSDLAGYKIKPPEVLFKKVEDEEIMEDIDKLNGIGGIQDKTINFDDFEKVDLRVAEIISAEKVLKSEKLLKLQIDLGYEKRQVIAGIAKKFAPEELIGKRLVVVANLKPVKIMGMESQAMILVAGDDDQELLFVQNVKVGSRIS
jgi:methionyl-tRNA synthetase